MLYKFTVSESHSFHQNLHVVAVFCWTLPGPAFVRPLIYVHTGCLKTVSLHTHALTF